jgi:hypothetical protein
MKVAIVVVAFNKVSPLGRLLKSLSNILLSQIAVVDLHFSIDGGGDIEVKALANAYSWDKGEKTVVVHDRNIGLKNNVYASMKLGLKYDAIIILEDDLYVSPYLLSDAIKLLEFYSASPEIAGISLYSPRFNETSYSNFIPINDNSDAYFMKIPSSWGQVYSRAQVESYFKWHDNMRQANPVTLPPNVARWSDKSWKKEFYQYLIELKKYLVYPRISLTTNYADAGVHHRGSDLYQVPLSLSNRPMQLNTFQSSNVIYDEYCEIESSSLKRLCRILEGYKFSVDLYGYKVSSNNLTDADYVLSTLVLENPVKSWDDSQIPLEMNCINDIPGKGLYLYERSKMSYSRYRLIKSRIKMYCKLHNIRMDFSFFSRMLGRS